MRPHLDRLLDEIERLVLLEHGDMPKEWGRTSFRPGKMPEDLVEKVLRQRALDDEDELEPPAKPFEFPSEAPTKIDRK